MLESLRRIFARTETFWVLLALLFILAAWLRFIDLDADPPLYFDGYGQSLSTDPYQYTFHARNKVIFGEADPLHADQWKIFEFTLVSGVSYLLFLLFGVSRFNANLSGLLLSFLSIILFVISLKKLFGIRIALIGAVFLLFNKVLFVYGRLPYLENGLIFWLSLLFLVFVYFRHSIAGKIIIGILIALAGLSGKMFGWVCLVPAIGAYWFEDRLTFRKNSLLILSSFLGSSFLWMIISYMGSPGILTQYLFDQTIGLYGFPEALKSPITFFQKLISFGNDSLFYILSPALGIAAFWSFMSLLRSKLKNNPVIYAPVIFMALWFISGQLFLMIGNYRPLRYEYMLYFPLVELIGIMFTLPLSLNEGANKKSRVLRYILFFLLTWIFLEQFAYSIWRAIGFSETYEEKAAETVWMMLAPAILITFMEARFNSFTELLSSKLIRISLLIFLLIWTGVDFGKDYLVWRQQKSFNIREAGRDIGEILNKDAVITGPMAPTLLLENNLRGVIYAVGISKRDTALFQKYPITHFAIDMASAAVVTKEFPQLEKGKLIADYWIRDSDVGIYKIWNAIENREAQKYTPTDYEMACSYIDSENYDSARYLTERFLDKSPKNKSALKLLSDVYSFEGEAIAALGVLKMASGLYPHDFPLLLSEGTSFQKLYIATKDDQYRAAALDCFRRVLKLDPYQADEIEALTRQIAAAAPGKERE